MMLRKSQLHARAHRLQLARIEALKARRALRQSARRAAVSPRGLLMGFALGFGAGRRLLGPSGKHPRSLSGLRAMGLVLPLLRFF